MKIKKQSIFFPHINYTVKVVPFEGKSRKGFRATCEKIDRHSCAINLPKECQEPTVVHEIIHAMQFMYNGRNMELADEFETSAYIAEYIFQQIQGKYKYGDI